uniref:EamA family transporter RarD n=1 Tax=Leucobacter soli TaxID=2812850 RepID=UPI001C40514D|nr:EamA family transporter RarD [Leucobacter soli]
MSSLPVAGSGGRGVIVSLGSSVAFGLVYFLTPYLAPMSGEEVWAIRTVVTLPFIALVLVSMRSGRQISEIGRRIRLRPVLALGVVACGALLGAQLWLFAWAPLNGRAMQAALGYFLLPLVLVVLGRLLYRDRMRWWQWLAAGIAAVGVVYEIVRVGGVSWETLLVTLGYPAYFVLRRMLRTNHLGGMFWEMAAAAPLATVLVVLAIVDGSALSVNPALWWTAPAVALFSAFALLLYVLAARLLPLSLFGLLSYAEPALLLVASLLMGERIEAGEWFTYGAIWAAVLVLVVGGLVSLRRPAE